MSFSRLVYYSAILGGWAALVGCLLYDLLAVRGRGQLGNVDVVAFAALVGGCVAAALSLVGSAGHGWSSRLQRALPALVGGVVSGAAGGWVGNVAFQMLGLPRLFGWILMGLGVGGASGVDGLFVEGRVSGQRLRNGLIGGGVGGLLGGLLFEMILGATGSERELAGRAFGFTSLGLSIGVMVGLAHVVLKEAWLTVVDGYRVGRQVVIDRDEIVLGRDDSLPLPLLGYGSRDVAPAHAKVKRTAAGRFQIEDLRTPIGTLVGGQRIDGRAFLGDGDLVRIGGNVLRFNIRSRRREAAADDSLGGGIGTIRSAPPPPPMSSGSMSSGSMSSGSISAGSMSAGSTPGRQTPPAPVAQPQSQSQPHPHAHPHPPAPAQQPSPSQPMPPSAGPSSSPAQTPSPEMPSPAPPPAAAPSPGASPPQNAPGSSASGAPSSGSSSGSGPGSQSPQPSPPSPRIPPPPPPPS